MPNALLCSRFYAAQCRRARLAAHAPPDLWLEEHELEPEADDAAAASYTHGAYPQRLPQLTESRVGESWGRMRHPGTCADRATAWLETFSTLLCAARPTAEMQERLVQGAERVSLALFVDAHNTGYYINSYTTDLNPTMDNVLRRLLDGVHRLREE